MADPKEPKDKKDRRQSSPVDFEKTVLDVDLKKLGDLKEEFPEGFEETVMVRLPEAGPEPETTDFFGEEERTGDHVVEEKPQPSAKTKAASRERKKTPEPAPPVKKGPPSEQKGGTTPPPPPRRPTVQDESSYTVMGKLLAERPQISWGYLGLSLLFFLMVAEAAVEVLGRGVGLKLAVTIASALGFLVLLLIFLRRLEGRTGFLWMSVVWFGLVAYSGFFFYTTDPEALTVIKLPLNELLGPFLLLSGLVLTWNLWQRRRYPMISKILAGLALLLLVLGISVALIQGTDLEGSFWGPAFLSGFPLYLRPGILALSLAFPLFSLGVLLALFVVRPTTKGKFRRFGIPLLILGLLGTALGIKVLARQGIGVPGVGPWLADGFVGLTLVDPVTNAVQLQVETGRKGQGREKEWHLVLAASRSVAKGKGRESRLMVKNMEGRSWAGILEKDLILKRGEKGVKGGEASLQISELGKNKNLYVLSAIPELGQPTGRIMIKSSLLRIARQLDPGDRLWVASAEGPQLLEPSNQAQWETLLGKALTGPPADPAQAILQGLKKLSPEGGAKQLMILLEGKALPPPEARQSLIAQAKGGKTLLNFIPVGPVAVEGEPYHSPDLSSLGFEMLAAAADTLGQYTLQFPNLAPLPRIQIQRDPSGQINLGSGQIAFSVLAPDPNSVGGIQLKIDEDKPIDLGRELQQSLDLSRFKVKPGPHRFTLSVSTAGGDVVSESFKGIYVTQHPLRFAKPMDRDTVGGLVNVLLSPGRVQGVDSGSVDLLVDGVKVGSATAEPYLIPLDTRTLGEGDHTLQAIQTFPDGNTETLQIQIKVNQQVPQVKIVRPSIGEYLSNLAEIEAQVGGGLFEQVQKVEFLVDGEWIGESLQAPYRHLWSNNAFPAGKYFVQARATLSSQAMTSDAVEVQLGQGEAVVQADPATSSSGMLFPDNVEVLLDASASMNEPLGASFKIDQAKLALSELMQGFPSEVHLQMRVFGGESYSSQNNCADTTFLNKPAPQLESLQARGTAPLAYNLRLLAQDLKKSSGSRLAILITDGWDKCGGDPLEIAGLLAKQTQRIRLHIIYFSDVDPATESLLKKLAEVLGGQVFQVSRQEELSRGIRDAIQVSFTLYDYKNSPVVSQPLNAQPFFIRAGDYRLEIDTAPPLKREKVVVPTGGRKTFTVLPKDGNFELREE